MFIGHVGRRLSAVLSQKEQREADFRFALMQQREAAEQIAMCKGATTELNRLDRLFSAIAANWRQDVSLRLRLDLGQQGACTATDRCASPLDRAVAELAETCAWPPTEPYDEIVNQLLKTLFEVRNHFRQQAMPKAERDHELKMGAVVAAYFHAQSQPGFDERAYFDEHPQAKEAMNMPPPSAQQLLREAEFDRQCVAQMAEMAAADALQFQLLTQNGS